MIRDRILTRTSQARQGVNPTGRVEMRGAVDIANVDQARYREDLGFNATDAQYKGYQANKAAFDAEYQNVVSSNTSALETNKGLMNQVLENEKSLQGKTVDQVWDETSKGFTKVYATGGGLLNGQLLGSTYATYYFPEDSAKAMAKKSFNQGDGSYPAWWGYEQNPELDKKTQELYKKAVGGNLTEADAAALGVSLSDVQSTMDQTLSGPRGRRYQSSRMLGQSALNNPMTMRRLIGPLRNLVFEANNVPRALYVGDTPIGASDRYGKELNEGLAKGQKEVKAAFYEQVGPKVDEYNTSVTKALDQTSKDKAMLQGYINTSEDNLAAAENAKLSRETELAAYKSQYETSKSGRQALFQ